MAIFRKLDLTEVSTLVLAIANIGLSFATLKLWLVTKQSVIDAEDTAERQLRAYLYVGPIDTNLENNTDGSSTFTVKPSVKIFGITPAAWVSAGWDLKMMAGSAPGQLPELPPGVSSTVEVPSQDYSLGVKSVTLEKADIEALKARTKVVVGFGKITYGDIFQKQRWTEFCWTFDWSDANTINGALCPRHNSTDWAGHPEWLNTSVSTEITINIKSENQENLPGPIDFPP